mgnify:CR=1 FL=1
MKNLLIKPNSNIKNALKQLSKTGEKCLVVVDKKNKLLGTLSDGDVRNAILKGNYYFYKNKNYLLIVPSKNKSDLNHKNKSFWGYYRAYLEAIFDFMELGYLVILELNGVGFRLKLEGNTLKFYLGFSHIKEYKIPNNIFVKIGNKKETELHLFGYDKQYLCQIAAQIKLLKKPDMYKGKGIFFFNETLVLKQGKQMDS